MRLDFCEHVCACALFGNLEFHSIVWIQKEPQVLQRAGTNNKFKVPAAFSSSFHTAPIQGPAAPGPKICQTLLDHVVLNHVFYKIFHLYTNH